MVVLLILLGVGGAGIWYWHMRELSKDAIELVLYGNVDVRQVELAINGTQRIAELFVEEGDRVQKGDLLAKLGTERLEYAVARATAQVER